MPLGTLTMLCSLLSLLISWTDPRPRQTGPRHSLHGPGRLCSPFCLQNRAVPVPGIVCVGPHSICPSTSALFVSCDGLQVRPRCGMGWHSLPFEGWTPPLRGGDAPWPALALVCVAVRICAGPALAPRGHVHRGVGRRVLRGVCWPPGGPPPLPPVPPHFTCPPAAHSIPVPPRLDSAYCFHYLLFF